MMISYDDYMTTKYNISLAELKSSIEEQTKLQSATGAPEEIDKLGTHTPSTFWTGY